MTKPDFIFVGASKSGSSWLHNYFLKHPGIFVPTAKDIYFFNEFYDRGTDWYERCFSQAKPGQVAGEICHDYLHNADAISRIATDYPDVKLICSLRQPIDRVISTYLYGARHGLVEPSLKAHVEKKRGIFAEGRYADDLGHVYEHFPRENVLVFLYDDLLEDPRALARRVTDFLGVEYFDYQAIDRKVRVASKARIGVIGKLGKWIASHMRAMGLHSMLGMLKNSAMMQKLLYKPIEVDNTMYYKELPSDVVEIYLDNIRRLEPMIDRPLAGWVDEIELNRSRV